MIEPFRKIDIQLLDDVSDSSNIELDGINFASANVFNVDNKGEMVDSEIQGKIHDTLIRMSHILKVYRDGELVWRKDKPENESDI